MRERERKRERERDGSDITLVALKLAMSFALFLAKNLHLGNWRRVLHFSLPKVCTLISPLLNGADFTLFVAKNVALLETVRILRKIHTLRFASVIWHDRGSQHRNKQSNFRLHRPQSSHRKNESN